MNKTFALIKREYLTRVRTKGFVAGTLLLPVFVLIIMFIPILFSKIDVQKQTRLAVIDLSGQVFGPLQRSVSEFKTDDKTKSLYRLEKIDPSSQPRDRLIARLSNRVLKGKLDAFLIIPEDIFTTNRFDLYSKNVSTFAFNQRISRFVSDVVIQYRLKESGLDPELVKNLSHRVSAKTFKVEETGTKEESSTLSFYISYIMVFILYFALVLYGTFVMRGIVEDKNSRVIEVVVSSVKPSQLMAGKILGIGAAGLTQLFVWALVGALVSMYGFVYVKMFNPEAQSMPIPSISIWVYVSLIIFFVLGYFLYATLYAAIGSMASNESDAQSLQWPAMIFLILSYMLMFAIVENPDGTLAVILSLIPLFSPVLMFYRVTVHAAPLYQVILSIVITTLSIWGFILLTGKIFRVGILMYGKKPNFPELMRWIRYS